MTIQALISFLSDPGINEFMLNGHDKAFVEWNGKMEPLPSPLRSEAEFRALVTELQGLESTTALNGLAFDGILPDGSRFHLTLPPLSPTGPSLTVRKFSRQHRSLADLTQGGFMTAKLATFLEACVKGKMNIVISGATGAGIETTLLNCLAGLIEVNERIVTIEDIPELQLKAPNWVRMLSVRGDRPVTVRDCVVGSMRMRPDRILIGECRSSEALEMLQAMNTGHDGGMTTVHANSTADALTRLESLIMFHAGADIPIRPLRRQLVDAIDLIIQIKRGPGGQRYVEEVMEAVGLEGDTITRSTIFKRVVGKDGNGAAEPTGHPPHFLERLAKKGIQFPKDFFAPERKAA